MLCGERLLGGCSETPWGIRRSKVKDDVGVDSVNIFPSQTQRVDHPRIMLYVENALLTGGADLVVTTLPGWRHVDCKAAVAGGLSVDDWGIRRGRVRRVGDSAGCEGDWE